RIFVVSELDAPLAGESLDRVAVISANIGRKRRLIGEQLLGRGQPGREIEPRAGEQDEGRERRPGQPANPQPLPPGIDTLVNALVEGDKVGKLRKLRKFPVGNGQTLELHSALRLAGSAWVGKLGLQS